MISSKDIEDLLNRGYRYALSLTHNEDDAYDLVYSSYLTLSEKRKPVALAYLIKTIKNKFVDQKRHLAIKTKWQVENNTNNSYQSEPTIEPLLEKLLGELPVREREIIFLSAIEDYTAQEIADLINIPRGSVVSILSRTKKKLRLELKTLGFKNFNSTLI